MKEENIDAASFKVVRDASSIIVYIVLVSDKIMG